MRFDAQTVRAASEALSGTSGFWFTRRCLMFELVRRGAWRDPGTDLDGCERDFAAALSAFEQRHGALERLVRPEQAIAGVTDTQLSNFDLPSDLFDYAIGRVALFERMDLCLMLIANGFHREIEIALTVPPDFPSHVWARIRAQLDAGLRTTFLVIHDHGAASEAWAAAVDEQFGELAGTEVRRAGLTVPWATRMRLPMRGTGPDGAPSPSSGPSTSGLNSAMDKPSQPMLGSSSYALLEELSPVRAMRWIYGRVARGAEDVGFG